MSLATYLSSCPRMTDPSGAIRRETLGFFGSGRQFPLRFCRRISPFSPCKNVPWAAWSRRDSSLVRLLPSASRSMPSAFRFSKPISWRIIDKRSFARGDLTATRPYSGPSLSNMYVTRANSRSSKASFTLMWTPTNPLSPDFVSLPNVCLLAGFWRLTTLPLVKP